MVLRSASNSEFSSRAPQATSQSVGGFSNETGSLVFSPLFFPEAFSTLFYFRCAVQPTDRRTIVLLRYGETFSLLYLLWRLNDAKTYERSELLLYCFLFIFIFCAVRVLVIFWWKRVSLAICERNVNLSQFYFPKKCSLSKKLVHGFIKATSVEYLLVAFRAILN